MLTPQEHDEFFGLWDDLARAMIECLSELGIDTTDYNAVESLSPTVQSPPQTVSAL